MKPAPPPDRPRPRPGNSLPPGVRPFLDDLVRLGLLGPSAADAFLADRAADPGDLAGDGRLDKALVQAGLLTAYQLERVRADTTHGLVLGSYTVLEELGRGGMGVVYRAEHTLMRRRVAVKVLPADDDCPASVRQRFYAEMRVLAELSHPNVVLALDAGEVPQDGFGKPRLIYLVMELVDGGDLEQHVLANGRLGVAQACDYVRQAACGLQAAHDRHLVHRDVKPSNLLLGTGGQIKLVDFGLARQLGSMLTDPRVLLGSVEFMAPEQSHDPSAVGKVADVYGLGATLFWLLTGEAPYPFLPSVGAALRALQRQEPRRLRSLRHDAPAELEDLLASMLARDPARRPPTPLAVATALGRFVRDRPATPTAPPRPANDPPRGHDALLATASKMAASADGESAGHRRRMPAYAVALARRAAAEPSWAGLVTDRFLENLERCVPLYDIGKAGLTDDVLHKPAAPSPAERALVEARPLLGDRLLEALGRGHGAAPEWLAVARAVARHHHERYDGAGYPDRLRGDAIPAAARLAAVADVYDALRRPRLHEPALTHAAAVRVILERSPGQFDPALLRAFAACHAQFERVYEDNPE